MDVIVAWMLAFSTPQYPEYVYYSTIYNTFQECMEAAGAIHRADRFSNPMCKEVVVWTPILPGKK
jgi:hypothetical protein